MGNANTECIYVEHAQMALQQQNIDFRFPLLSLRAFFSDILCTLRPSVVEEKTRSEYLSALLFPVHSQKYAMESRRIEEKWLY